MSVAVAVQDFDHAVADFAVCLSDLGAKCGLNVEEYFVVLNRSHTRFKNDIVALENAKTLTSPGELHGDIAGKIHSAQVKFFTELSNLAQNLLVGLSECPTDDGDILQKLLAFSFKMRSIGTSLKTTPNSTPDQYLLKIILKLNEVAKSLINDQSNFAVFVMICFEGMLKSKNVLVAINESGPRKPLVIEAINMINASLSILIQVCDLCLTNKVTNLNKLGIGDILEDINLTTVERVRTDLIECRNVCQNHASFF
jgi:hypothetical protein